MIDAAAALAGAAQLAASAPAWLRFAAALAEPRAAQRAVLARLLRGAAGSAFAREHGLTPGLDVEALRRRVPPRDHDAFRPWLDRAAAGERAVLADARVQRFQPSSGSAAAVKLLPWTAPFAAEVRAAVSAWLGDQLRRHPALLGGPAYWSVSPAGPAHPPTAGGLPVGFEDDAAYLGPLARRLATAALAVPGAVRHLADPDAWRRRTLLHLVRARELRLLSVWSPSFVPLLLEPLAALLPGLAAEVARGSPALEVAAGVVLPPLPPAPRRAAELERAGADPLRLWPRLALVSAWADGPSEGEAERLRARLPGVPLEPKGLIATEAVVSIPFGGGRPLAVGSHLLEVETGAGPRLVHELREGDVGSVLVTTGAGLWRYRLQDRVEVTGFVRRTPSVRFLGKEDLVCDRFGEKLHAGFVGAVLARWREELPASAGLAFLAPDAREGRACYTAFVAAGEAGIPPGAAARLDGLLAEGFHYAHCRRLGQLGPARVFRVEGDGLGPFHAACVARGQRLGDVKPSPLRREPDWAEALPGAYADG